MARAKKTEKKVEVIVKEAVKPSYGTGRTRINNMLQAGYSLRDIEFWEERKNE